MLHETFEMKSLKISFRYKEHIIYRKFVIVDYDPKRYITVVMLHIKTLKDMMLILSVITRNDDRLININ